MSYSLTSHDIRPSDPPCSSNPLDDFRFQGHLWWSQRLFPRPVRSGHPGGRWLSDEGSSLDFCILLTSLSLEEPGTCGAIFPAPPALHLNRILAVRWCNCGQGTFKLSTAPALPLLRCVVEILLQLDGVQC
jgi:hypothetical protein